MFDSYAIADMLSASDSPVEIVYSANLRLMNTVHHFEGRGIMFIEDNILHIWGNDGLLIQKYISNTKELAEFICRKFEFIAPVNMLAHADI